MKRLLLLIAMFAAVLATACDDGSAALEPAWGKQACAHCAMVLSDKRFGAQLVASDGERYFFDDVGCMVLYAEQHGLTSARAWVRDAGTGRWVDAQRARYVAGAASPMDFGFEARAQDGVSFADMRDRVIAKGRIGR